MNTSAAEGRLRQFDRGWYIDDIRDILVPSLEEGRIGPEEAIKELFKRFSRNKGDNDKKVLSAEGLDEFFALAAKVMSMASDGCAVGMKGKIPNDLYRYLLSEKGIGEGAEAGGVRIGSVMCHEGWLYIDGDYGGHGPGGRDRPLHMCLNGDERPLDIAGEGLETIYFGRRLFSCPAFHARIPRNEADSGSLWFYFEGEGPCPVSFRGPTACLCPRLGRTLGKAGPVTLECRQGRTIELGKAGKAKWALQEFRGAGRLMAQKFRPRKKLYELCIDALYILTMPYFRNKRIWLYFDKLYMGGDNGERLFEYASREMPGIRHYYIARKDSEVYRQLRARGLEALAFGSIRCRLMALHSELAFATHAGVLRFVGLNKFQAEFYACHMNMKVACIQHGLTIQRIPQYQGRTVDNTCMYFCASPMEIENLGTAPYGYEPSMLKLTGLPRYDSLVSDPAPFVLLAPTWRRSAVIEGNRMGTAKSNNPAFKETRWFRVYSGLIGDRALAAGLKAAGQRLVFLLHPTVSSQKADFSALLREGDDTVEVLAATECGYEALLRSASLLVTDYSGIQFDFAWMGKPIVYYHNDELPPTYDTDIFDYESDGFGPVAKCQEELVDNILRLSAGGFRQGARYKDNVGRFFAYRDRHNCERVLKEAVKAFERQG